MLTVNYIATAIDLITKNNSSSSRQIPNMQTGRGRGHNANSGGRGRGRGRGRGGRGRGRSNNQEQGSNAPSNNDAGRANQSGRSYSTQEWQNLTVAQQRQIYRENEWHATARAVAAMIRETDNQGSDDVSAMTRNIVVPTPASTQGTQGPSSQAQGAVSLSNVSGAMS
jgi:hypothetical protein